MTESVIVMVVASSGPSPGSVRRMVTGFVDARGQVIVDHRVVFGTGGDACEAAGTSHLMSSPRSMSDVFKQGTAARCAPKLAGSRAWAKNGESPRLVGLDRGFVTSDSTRTFSV